MPFKSKAQRKWMYSKHPTMAKRWEKHTTKVKLPAKVRQDAAKAALKQEKPEL